MKNQSIVCFANDWRSDPTSKHHVMKILSKDNRILWVDSITMRTPSLSSPDIRKAALRIRNCFRGLTRVNENLYHFGPLVVPLPASSVARYINKYLLIASITHHKKALNMRDVQLWTFFPNAVDLIGHLGEKLVVYYCVDEWSKFTFIDSKSFQKMEQRLLLKSDLVITTASHLFRHKILANRNTHLVTHGVDYEYFSQALTLPVDVPEEMRALKKPVIGFFGLIHEWIDLELIARMAACRPQWSIVLVGNAAVDTRRLKDLPNVHLLGRQPYEKLTGYCRSFDVGIIPFRVNELTVNVNPIKLREYLAAGLPVVSTALPEVKKYSDIVEIGSDHDDFIHKIDLVLEQDSIEKRASRSHRMGSETWERKVEEITSLIAALPQKRDSSLGRGQISVAG